MLRDRAVDGEDWHTRVVVGGIAAVWLFAWGRCGATQDRAPVDKLPLSEAEAERQADLLVEAYDDLTEEDREFVVETLTEEPVVDDYCNPRPPYPGC